MKVRNVIKGTVLILFILNGQAIGYSGDLWLSQANERFGTPANMLAHGFLAGVVHSWNGRRDNTTLRDMCFNAPPQALRIRDLMAVVSDYISDSDPDLAAPAQGIIRIAMMAKYPCEP